MFPAAHSFFGVVTHTYLASTSSGLNVVATSRPNIGLKVATLRPMFRFGKVTHTYLASKSPGLNVAWPQRRLASMSPGLNVAWPQCRGLNVAGLNVAWPQCPIVAIKMLLAEETLQVNSVNKFGISALDMVNTDDIVIPFLERQAVFKDVNLRKIKMPLLVSALKESRLDLASSLLDDSSGTYQPSPSELATARDKLVVVLHYASEKRTLLKLLHKLEVKQEVQ